MIKVKPIGNYKKRWIGIFWIMWIFVSMSTYYYNMLTQIPGRWEKIVAKFMQIMDLFH